STPSWNRARAMIPDRKPCPTRRGLMLGASSMFLGGTLSWAADAPAAGVTTRTCLFLDNRFIAEQAGLTRTWHQGKPMRVANQSDKAWESWPHLFGSVFFDPKDRLYRMYYEAVNPGGRPPYCILYAESKDGRQWTKPELGLHEVNGSKANNCV